MPLIHIDEFIVVDNTGDRQLEAYKHQLDSLVDSQLGDRLDPGNCQVVHRILVDLVLDIVGADTLIDRLVAELCEII